VTIAAAPGSTSTRTYSFHPDFLAGGDDVAATAQIGVTGLAVMGRNLARNLARHGHTVALHNRTASRTHDLVAAHGDEGTFVPSDSMAEFVASLERPRRVVIMV
jgi:6-phosphogluconate dehydrogenase